MHIPVATYRLQFNPPFGFCDAKKIVSCLSELGISDVYASPITKPKKGSTHGYDVVDPKCLNPELGTAGDFEALMSEVKLKGMGWIQDIVPNHMAYDSDNVMLMDIFENGQRSRYIHVFDIQWDHRHESVRGRVLAPFLGKFYEDALEAGEIVLRYDESGFTINYYEYHLPLRIESYVTAMTYRLQSLKSRLGSEHPDIIKYLGLIFILKSLSSGEDIGNWYEQIRFVKSLLWELYQSSQDIQDFLDENIRIFNGEKGKPQSFNLLHQLLCEQHFRLSFWKVAMEEINYRRFFNINGLISLRMEDADVFEQKHGLVLRLAEEGKIQGLRIDHVDGLYDPTIYLRRLRERVPDAYIVVEKILEPEEDLPGFWPVQGTTGYDFLNYANGVLCQTKNEKEFEKIYSKYLGFRFSYYALILEKKRLIIGRHMAGDVERLAYQIEGISSKDRYGSDITIYGLKRALVELLAIFPVYRTYMSNEIVSETDQACMKQVINQAKEENPGLVHELDFIERFLLPGFASYLTKEQRHEAMNFVMRFQQLTGPLMAKGLEDTVFYVYNRLISLNEVGGSPGKFGFSIDEFHAFSKFQAEHWPHTLNTTATHDTKRGEDTRARISALSEMPDEWDKHLKLWSKINLKKKKPLGNIFVPDRNDEYFLYQTLLGALPFGDYDAQTAGVFKARIREYVVKAVREAKVHTAWLKPDFDYENKFMEFVDFILTPSEKNEFLQNFLPFQRKVAFYGLFNSLSQMMLKLASPGVPDFYQGTELWDFSLVDPDNRRPVDFEQRAALLKTIKEKATRDLPGLMAELLDKREDGRVKLFLIWRVLAARLANKDLFQSASYVPLKTTGQLKEHVIAFARNTPGGKWAVTVVTRFLSGVVNEGKLPLGESVWQDTAVLLPEDAPGKWRDAISGAETSGTQKLPIGSVLGYFPVALLVGTAD